MLLNFWYRFLYFINDFKLYIFLLSLFILALIFLSIKIHKSKISEKKKKIFFVGFFSLFFIILTFSGFEAYFRYRFDESDSLGFLKVNGRWFARHIVFNSYFVRDREFTLEKKEGVVRIGVIGDSIAMGYGIKNVDDRFSNLLEKKLRDAGKNVEVLNLGESGADTDAEIVNYNKAKKLNFDIIVWEYFLNDAQPDNDKNIGRKILLKEGRRGALAKFISSYSYFFDYAYWRLAARYEKTFGELRNADIAAYKDKELFEGHKTSVKSFIKQLKDENKKVVVIVFPFMYFLPNYPAKDIHLIMGNFFRENGIEPIDLLDDLKDKSSKDLIVSRFDYHPNVGVQELAAQRLYDKILPMLTQPAQ